MTERIVFEPEWLADAESDVITLVSKYRNVIAVSTFFNGVNWYTALECSDCSGALFKYLEGEGEIEALEIAL